jgi:hypothetical protein
MPVLFIPFLEDLQYFHARQRDFQARIAQVVVTVRHERDTSLEPVSRL